MNDAQYRDTLSKIVSKTYTAHGLKKRPWGRNRASESCSYAAGCAIGLSLSPELAEKLDQEGSYQGGMSIGGALTIKDVRTELFGSADDLPQWVIDVLNRVQFEHDQRAARTRTTEEGQDALRREYRKSLRAIAKDNDLTLN